MARIYAARGFDSSDQIAGFLDPALSRTHDPFLMRGMEAAVARIAQAVGTREPIWIYGDYDVDGVTATAILKSAFDFLSVPVQTYIPHRLNEGYGLRAEAIESLAKKGARLIITVDNGTTALGEIELASRLGIDVIVTDHHEPGERLPSAHALINPKQEGCEYPFKELCGAGVAFKLAHAILKRMAGDAAGAREFLKTLLDFVAVGTLADVVPLTGENRAFVAHGLKILRNGCRPGFKTLMEVIKVNPAEVGAGNLAFTVVPRLNAAGRTEHAEYALDLLLTTDPARARELANLLNQFNDERRRIESEITEEALEQIDESGEDAVLVLYREGWHPGIVGIVASRVLERYYRPVIVLGIEGERAKGSARSIRGFDIHSALTACREHLEQFGGHTMAAGLSLKTSSLDAFGKAIRDHARSVMTESELSPVLSLDAIADAEDLTLDNARALEAMGPFGPGNPRPILEMRGFHLVEEPRVLRDKHLKLRLAAPDGRAYWAIGFGQGHRCGEIDRGGRTLCLAATPTVNSWGGKDRLELEIKDFKVE